MASRIESGVSAWHVHPPRLLTWRELEIHASGNPAVDLGMLKKPTTYHGFVASDPLCRRFWRVMEALSAEVGSPALPPYCCASTRMRLAAPTLL